MTILPDGREGYVAVQLPRGCSHSQGAKLMLDSLGLVRLAKAFKTSWSQSDSLLGRLRASLILTWIPLLQLSYVPNVMDLDSRKWTVGR